MPDTASSTTTGPHTGRSPPWTVGPRCSRSSAPTSPATPATPATPVKEADMCTTISDTVTVEGAAKGGGGWFPITAAVVGFDHATGSAGEHAVLLDFVDPARGPAARVAVELDLASGRALLTALAAVLAAAERSGVAA